MVLACLPHHSVGFGVWREMRPLMLQEENIKVAVVGFMPAVTVGSVLYVQSLKLSFMKLCLISLST